MGKSTAWARSPLKPGDGVLDVFHLQVTFTNELTPEQFERFVSDHLENRDSPFKLGGYVTRRGPTKAHMNAYCGHGWCTFIMEVTSEGITAVFNGTPPNITLYQFLVNIREHLTPHSLVSIDADSLWDANTAGSV